MIRHHSDYNKPLEVIILCSKCHNNWHKNNKVIERIKYNQIKFIGDPKKDKIITATLDAKLYEQLKRYADKNDEGIVSVSARRALKKFLEETEASGLKNK